MSKGYIEPQRAIILWLSGMCLADIRSLPEVVALNRHGALVELDPLQITGSQAQHFQVFSGCSPASFGFFDTLIPYNYVIKENLTGRGEAPLLPDMLRSAGWNVEYEQTQPSNLVKSIQHWTQMAYKQKSCLIVKCTVEDTENIQPFLPEIVQALSYMQAWVDEPGLLALLSDSHPARIERFVNLNNFLAEMGMMERDEQSHTINWSNSLAYFAGHGQLWLNLLGRDAQGAVHPKDEAEEVRDTLVKALPAKLRDPQTGKPVIERVYRKEELYSREYLFCAPDLVVLFAPGYAPSPHSTLLDFDEEIFIPPVAGEYASAGVHPSLVGGFLLASAPPLAASVTAAERAPLTSVVPTLLHALGIEYSGVEGSIICSLFSPSYLEKHPLRSVMGDEGLSEEDEDLIINRLRDLGYV
jgi:hypothetical protein